MKRTFRILPTKGESFGLFEIYESSRTPFFGGEPYVDKDCKCVGQISLENMVLLMKDLKRNMKRVAEIAEEAKKIDVQE